MATQKMSNVSKPTKKVAGKGRKEAGWAYPSSTLMSVVIVIKTARILNRLESYYRMSPKAVMALMFICDSWLYDHKGVTCMRLHGMLHTANSVTTLRPLSKMLLTMVEKGIIETMGRNDRRALLYVPTHRTLVELSKAVEHSVPVS